MMKNLTGVSLIKCRRVICNPPSGRAERLNEAICGMQESNEKKLEEMRRTVDEKLSETLNARLDASFKTVCRAAQQRLSIVGRDEGAFPAE